MIEKTNWGKVEWCEEEAFGSQKNGMKVGTVELNPGAHQSRHVHYDEQVFYYLSGEARMYVDGKEVEVGPGVTYHWNPGVVHEVYCTGTEPFRHLIISGTTTNLDDLLDLPRMDTENKYDREQISGWLYSAVEAIRTQFLETLHYAYAIFDLSGNVVARSKFQSRFCDTCCNIPDKDELSPCMEPASFQDMGFEKEMTCPYGMTVFRLPLTYNQQLMGYIQGGYIRMPGEELEEADNIYEIPESTAFGIQNLLRKIAKAIRNYCEFESFHMQLIKKENQIASETKVHQRLEQNLKDAQYTMTELRINNHFLFNTLNSMASMALKDKNKPLYHSIVDLSKLFRYTLQYTGNIVAMKKEFEYLKAYLDLQKLRYGEELEVNYDVDPTLDEVQVPYNFMQPIAENAFKHGFKDTAKKVINLHIQKVDGHLDIRICNSGKYMNRTAVRNINKSMKSNTAHGLSMVYYKLASIYQDNFLFEILSDEEKGTRFHLELPMEITAERGTKE